MKAFITALAIPLAACAITGCATEYHVSTAGLDGKPRTRVSFSAMAMDRDNAIFTALAMYGCMNIKELTICITMQPVPGDGFLFPRHEQKYVDWKRHGLVLDYLSKDVFDRYWNTVVDPLLKQAGPLGRNCIEATGN